MEICRLTAEERAHLEKLIRAFEDARYELRKTLEALCKKWSGVVDRQPVRFFDSAAGINAIMRYELLDDVCGQVPKWEAPMDLDPIS